MSAETCYACEEAASTVEHCPPKCFFPGGQRNHLITVPSCPKHNNDNSKDVEYARNSLTALWGVNESGLGLLGGKVKRSFDRSPKLWSATFSTMQTILYEGQVTGAYQLDTHRLVSVFEACARAIHYHEKREKHFKWGITMPRLMFSPDVPEGGRQSWSRFCDMLRQISFAQRPTANPEVFEYGRADVEGHPLYLFVFYQSFPVYALPLPEAAGVNTTLVNNERAAG